MTDIALGTTARRSRQLRGARLREWAVAATLTLCAVALAATLEPVRGWLAEPTPAWTDLLQAPLLGIGEATLASLTFQAIVMTRSTGSEQWALRYARALATARRGWGATLRWASDDAPFILAAGTCVVVALTHEAALRGAVLALAETTGNVPAVAVGVVLSVAVRVAAAPTARSALHPACGAAMLGAIHGPLVLAGAGVAPLVVAHAVVLLVVHRG